jgi:hypothetical protein
MGLLAWNLRIATTLSKPSLLSDPLSPNCPARSHPQYMNINHNLYSSYIQDILLPHKRGSHASRTNHSTSTDGYQLHIAHLVDKDKYFYIKGNIQKSTTMQPITITQEPYT